LSDFFGGNAVGAAPRCGVIQCGRPGPAGSDGVAWRRGRRGAERRARARVNPGSDVLVCIFDDSGPNRQPHGRHCGRRWRRWHGRVTWAVSRAIRRRSSCTRWPQLSQRELTKVTCGIYCGDGSRVAALSLCVRCCAPACGCACHHLGAMRCGRSRSVAASSWADRRLFSQALSRRPDRCGGERACGRVTHARVSLCSLSGYFVRRALPSRVVHQEPPYPKKLRDAYIAYI